MRCFFHPDREGVATCVKCGRVMCNDCAHLNEQLLCPICFDEQKQQEEEAYKQAQIDEQKKIKNWHHAFIIKIVIGAAISILPLYEVISWYINFLLHDEFDKFHNYFALSTIVFLVFLFFLPFGIAWAFPLANKLRKRDKKRGSTIWIFQGIGILLFYSIKLARLIVHWVGVLIVSLFSGPFIFIKSTIEWKKYSFHI